MGRVLVPLVADEGLANKSTVRAGHLALLIPFRIVDSTRSSHGQTLTPLESVGFIHEAGTAVAHRSLPSLILQLGTGVHGD
jgi:hypothetical protein